MKINRFVTRVLNRQLIVKEKNRTTGFDRSDINSVPSTKIATWTFFLYEFHQTLKTNEHLHRVSYQNGWKHFKQWYKISFSFLLQFSKEYRMASSGSGWQPVSNLVGLAAGARSRFSVTGHRKRDRNSERKRERERERETYAGLLVGAGTYKAARCRVQREGLRGVGSACRGGRGCWRRGKGGVGGRGRERTRKGGVGVATPGESQSPADLNAPRNLARRPRNPRVASLSLPLNRKRWLSRHTGNVVASWRPSPPRGKSCRSNILDRDFPRRERGKETWSRRAWKIRGNT